MRQLSRRALLAVLLAVVAGAALPRAVFAADPFITARELDLTRFLAPPPPEDSEQTRRELAEVLSYQVTRTQPMVDRAVADAREVVWRFADVMGPGFTAEDLPGFGEFFERLVATEDAVLDPTKEVWGRRRPHLLSTLVAPVVPRRNSGSYPSGHSASGTIMAVVLSNMVPERRAQIMARAWEYGENRLVAGIHFRSDVEMGRIAGMLIVERMMQEPAFETAFQAGRRQLRTRMGLQ